MPSPAAAPGPGDSPAAGTGLPGPFWRAGEEPLGLQILQALAELGGTLKTRFTALGEEFGIPSLAALRILELLRNASEPVGPSRLGREMHLTRGAVTQLLHTMERRSLIARTGSPGDARLSGAVLTDAGRASLEAILPHSAERAEALFRVLSGEEQRQFLATLRILQAQLASGLPG